MHDLDMFFVLEEVMTIVMLVICMNRLVDLVLMVSSILNSATWCCSNNIIDSKNHFSGFRCTQQHLSLQMKRFSDAKFLNIVDFTNIHV